MTALRPVLSLLRDRTTLVWAGLLTATLSSWAVGADHGLDPRLATPIVLLVAFVKVRFVGAYFMELRRAPRPLRLIFDGYCLIVGLTVLILSTIR